MNRASLLVLRFLPLGVLLLGACRPGAALSGGTPTPQDSGALSGSTSKDEPPPPPADGSDGKRAVAQVDLGPYRDDPRIQVLVAEWPARVDRAVERIETVTGLRFPSRNPPRVVLAPLGDEAKVYAVDSEIRDGRRRAILRVNVEVFAAGRGDVDLVLLHGLAAAALDDPGARETPLPKWTALAAGLAAGGNLPATLARIGDRLARDVPSATMVDPDDPSAAEPTAAAALLLLLGKGDPAAIRTYFTFVGDGDPPGPLLARTIGDPEGQWVGAGRDALLDAVHDQGTSRFELLPAADRVLQEQGRAALLALLAAKVPDPPPPELEVEVRLLRARAAEAEGDYAAARQELEGLSPGAASRVRDPADLARLRADAERAAGDPRTAQRLESEFVRDYPRAARGAGRTSGADAAADTPESMDLPRAVERAQALLFDHRIGAAEHLLAAMGDRGLAPELAGVSRAVAAAQQDPSEEALAANRARVAAYLAFPDEDRAQAVRDGGAAASIALAAVLPHEAGPDRARLVRLLAEAGGAEHAVRSLAPIWRASPRNFVGDVATLTAVAPYDEVRVWVTTSLADAFPAALDPATWSRARLGLSEAWVREHAQVLRDLADPRFAVRRTAFDLVVNDPASEYGPLLVGTALADPAALLRREAVRVAAAAGFSSLVAIGLADESWIVRQSAAASARSLGPLEIPRLLRLLASDPVTEVRKAAALALMELGPSEARVLDALVATQSEDDPALRDDVASRWSVLPPRDLAPAVVRALDHEASRRAPRPAVLMRLFAALRPCTGFEAGYYPRMPRPELNRALAKAHRAAGVR